MDNWINFAKNDFTSNYRNRLATHNCTKFNETLVGDFHDEEFQYTEITFNKCQKLDNCSNDTEISDFLDKYKLEVHFVDTYTDLKNPTETVKAFLEDRMFSTLKLNTKKRINFFL